LKDKKNQGKQCAMDCVITLTNKKLETWRFMNITFPFTSKLNRVFLSFIFMHIVLSIANFANHFCQLHSHEKLLMLGHCWHLLCFF
jgi:hypothetical protein